MTKLFASTCCAALLALNAAAFAQDAPPAGPTPTAPPAPAAPTPSPLPPAPPEVVAPAQQPTQAQQAPAAPSQPPAAQPSEERRLADNQIRDEVNARIAELKASLRLTAEQDRNWGGFESAIRDLGVAEIGARLDWEARREQERRERRERRRGDQAEAERSDYPAVLRVVADDMAERATHLRKVAEAAESLYPSLDERQRRQLVRFVRRGFRGVER